MLFRSYCFAFQAQRPVEYFVTKFKNLKQLARTVDATIKKQNITGGGSLSNQEKRIIKSPGYLELAKKMGKSASGNVAGDSDSADNKIQAPTKRTVKLFSTDEVLDEIPNSKKTYILIEQLLYIVVSCFR